MMNATYKPRLLSVITLFGFEFVLEIGGRLFDRKTWHPLATLRLESEPFDPSGTAYWFGPLHWTWCKLPPRGPRYPSYL